ncbi:MAG: hypothetical protein ACPGUD_11695 [Parashewanella sp.]
MATSAISSAFSSDTLKNPLEVGKEKSLVTLSSQKYKYSKSDNPVKGDQAKHNYENTGTHIIAGKIGYRKSQNTQYGSMNSRLNKNYFGQSANSTDRPK